MIDVAACRGHFPSLGRKVRGRPVMLFDGPAGTQTPRECIDAISDYLERSNANAPHGAPFGLSPASAETAALLDEARRGAADLLGAHDPEEISFGQSMTALAFASSRRVAAVLEPGDEIVVSPIDHAANVLPWELAARERGATVRRIVPTLPDATVAVEAVADAVGPRTRLVAIGLANNAVGTLLPAGHVARIAEVAHRVGAWLWVDAVHAAPHVPVDVNTLGADFVVFSAYKIYAPHLGVLWTRRHILERLPAQNVGWGSLSGRWETGTPAFELLAGFCGTLDYLASLADVDGDRRRRLLRSLELIRSRELTLAARLLDGLVSAGAIVHGIADPARLAERCPTFGFSVPGCRPPEIVNALLDRGIVTWSGDFACGELFALLGLESAVRAGIAHYTTDDEVDALVDGLRAVVA